METRLGVDMDKPVNSELELWTGYDSIVSLIMSDFNMVAHEFLVSAQRPNSSSPYWI